MTRWSRSELFRGLPRPSEATLLFYSRAGTEQRCGGALTHSYLSANARYSLSASLNSLFLPITNGNDLIVIFGVILTVFPYYLFQS
jgi:hypothetical protein